MSFQVFQCSSLGLLCIIPGVSLLLMGWFSVILGFPLLLPWVALSCPTVVLHRLRCFTAYHGWLCVIPSVQLLLTEVVFVVSLWLCIIPDAPQPLTAVTGSCPRCSTATF